MKGDIIEEAMDAAEAELENRQGEDEAERPVAASKGEEEAEPEETDESAPVDVAIPASDLPEFWPADLKALASKAPKELLAKFKEYDHGRTEWANKTAGESSRGKQIEQRVTEVFAPYRNKLVHAGIKDPIDATERLLAWNEMLTSDNLQERKGAISKLLQQAGMTPHDLLDDDEQDSQSDPINYDPIAEEALDEARQAREDFQSYKRELQEEKIGAEISQFRAGKDSTGSDREPFVRMFEPQIADAVTEIRNMRPDLSSAEQLHHAYEFVIGEARKSGMLSSPSRAPPAGRAIAAASSVSGSRAAVAPSRSKLKGNSFEEKLDSALDEALDNANIR